VTQGDAFVLGPPLFKAHPDGRHDMIGTGQGGAGIGRRGEGEGVTCPPEQCPAEGAEQFQFMGIHIVQTEFAHTNPGLPAQQGHHKQRGADTAAADQGQFHGFLLL